MEAAYVVSWGLTFSFWSTDKPNQASIYLFILYIFLLLNTVDIHYDISFVITHCMTYWVSSPWVRFPETPHIISRMLLTLFPSLYFISPWLFCNCQFLLFNPFTCFTHHENFLSVYLSQTGDNKQDTRCQMLLCLVFFIPSPTPVFERCCHFIVFSASFVVPFVFPFCCIFFLSFSFFKDFIHLFLGRGMEDVREGETSMCGGLSRTPSWGPGPHPGYMPWLGIKLVTHGLQVSTQSTEPHQPVHFWIFFFFFLRFHSLLFCASIAQDCACGLLLLDFHGTHFFNSLL